MKFREFSDRKAQAHALASDVVGWLTPNPKALLALPGGSTPVDFFKALKPHLSALHPTITLTDEREDGSNEALVRKHLLHEHSHFVKVEDAPALLPFDAVVLGMGEDGHIASLFPDEHMDEGLITHVTRPDFKRTSLTLKALSQTKQLALLITGEKKREVLESDADLPIHAMIDTCQAPINIYWTR